MPWWVVLVVFFAALIGWNAFWMWLQGGSRLMPSPRKRTRPDDGDYDPVLRARSDDEGAWLLLAAMMANRRRHRSDDWIWASSEQATAANTTAENACPRLD